MAFTTGVEVRGGDRGHARAGGDWDFPPSARTAEGARLRRVGARPGGGAFWGGDDKRGSRLSFALFRREGGGLRRVREPEEVRLESERGSATFSGTASRVLATDVPGHYPVFVVVSARNRLPSHVETVDALRSSGRLIYPMTITLLPEDLP
jgi:hypothetical protein